MGEVVTEMGGSMKCNNRTLNIFHKLNNVGGLDVIIDKNNIGTAVVIKGDGVGKACRDLACYDHVTGGGKNPVVVISGNDMVVLAHSESKWRYKKLNDAVVERLETAYKNQ